MNGSGWVVVGGPLNVVTCAALQGCSFLQPPYCEASMKWLEMKAKEQAASSSVGPTTEHKMKSGARHDQRSTPAEQPAHKAPATKPQVIEYAASLGVDVSKVIGTGQGGEILKRDVKFYADSLKAKEGDSSTDENDE